MDSSRRSKLWAGLFAISLILSSTVVTQGTSSIALAKGLGTSSSLKMPSNDHERKAFPIIEEAATILGLQADKIKQSLSEGKSLLDIAKEQSMSEADFSNRLLAVRTSKVDEAVKAGKITQEKADHVKARMQEHISFMIHSKNLQDLHSMDQKKRFSNEAKQMMSPAKLSLILGIPEDKLVEQLKAGKSIAEIAQAQGISKQQLIDKIKEQLTPFLEKAVDHKSK
jgi:DNA-binding CsgD family transcriptional regulator